MNLYGAVCVPKFDVYSCSLVCVSECGFGHGSIGRTVRSYCKDINRKVILDVNRDR